MVSNNNGILNGVHSWWQKQLTSIFLKQSLIFCFQHLCLKASKTLRRTFAKLVKCGVFPISLPEGIKTQKRSLGLLQSFSSVERTQAKVCSIWPLLARHIRLAHCTLHACYCPLWLFKAEYFLNHTTFTERNSIQEKIILH